MDPILDSNGIPFVKIYDEAGSEVTVIDEFDLTSEEFKGKEEIETLDSETDMPSDKALVESLISNFTPCSPILAILWIFAIGPIGVISNLKSPVVTIVPLGVWIIIPWESGIECVVLKNSILKYFKNISKYFLL